MKRSIELPATGHRPLAGTTLRNAFNDAPKAAGEAPVATGRIHGLAEAIVLVNANLDLHTTLRSVVASAMTLTGAEYGGLGVWGSDGRFSETVPAGFDAPGPAKKGALLTDGGVSGRVDRLQLEQLVRHPQTIGPSPRGSHTATFLGVQIRVRSKLFGALYLTTKRGGGHFTEVDELNIQTLIAAAATAIDHARRHEQIRARLAWNETIRDIRTEFMTGSDAVGALTTIARGLCQLTDSDTVLVAQPRADEQPPETVRELIISAAEGGFSAGLLGRAIAVGSVAPGYAYPDLPPIRRGRLDVHAVVSGSGVNGPTMVLPLGTDQTMFGVLLVSRVDGRAPYTQETLDLATEFAGQVALGLSMAVAVDRNRELEVLADRERIARILHDHVIQRIFAAGINVQGTLQRAQSPVVRRRLTETANDLQDIIQEVRTTIFDLQPDGRESTRLRQRVHEVIDQQTRDFTGRTFVRMSGPLSVVSPGLTEHAVAVVREGVTNAVRYAGSEMITVSLSVDDDLVIEIVDDGVGMDDDVTPSGLTNLRGRAQDLGGGLTLTTNTTGSGVVLRWWAPLDH